MQYAILAAALVAGAAATHIPHPASNVTYVTETVEHLTTICPSSGVYTFGDKTTTVTEATTLTISNCGCPVTHVAVPSKPAKIEAPPAVETHPAPVETHVPAAPVETHVAPAPSAVETHVPVAPAETHVATYPVPNAPAPAAPTASAPSAAPVSPSSPAPSPFEGAGNKVAVSGLSLAALAGVAAFFL